MFIEKFLNKDGSINAGKITPEDILILEKATLFLQLNPTPAQRVKAILHKCTEHRKCPVCGTLCKYNPSKISVFKNYCGMSCAKKDTKQNTELFLKTLKTKNERYERDFENAKIVSIEETRKLFIDNIQLFINGGSKGINFLKKNPKYYKSLLHYTYPEKVLGARIYELVYGPPKCECCDNRTSFISLKDGYRRFCSVHYSDMATKIRGNNAVKSALELLQSFDNFNEYELIKIPEKLNDSFTLKHHRCKKEFDLWLRNGKLSDYNLHCGYCENKTISSQEREIVRYLNSLNIKYIQQYPVENKKLDIFLPDYNIAIEHHGPDHTYGKHKSQRFNNHEIEDKNKHLDRHIMCEKYGIRLIHVFHWEWTKKSKRDIVKSIISSTCGKNEKVYARKCEVKVITNKQASDFVEINHLQGNVKSSIQIGLFHKNELVSVMTFGKPRNRYHNKVYDFELIRFCNKLNLTIIGGASKLFQFFIKHYNPETILSFCDKRYFNGDIYKSLGFSYIKDTNPNYYYIKGALVYNRTYFQKHMLKSKIDNYDAALTEKDNMYNNGYRRMWDCGNMMFVWTKEKGVI